MSRRMTLGAGQTQPAPAVIIAAPDASPKNTNCGSGDFVGNVKRVRAEIAVIADQLRVNKRCTLHGWMPIIPTDATDRARIVFDK